MAEYRYKAFISYSHHDEWAARWLHRALEAFRPPAGTVPEVAERPGRPRRPLAPVFRDQEELVAAASLSEAIRQALAESEYLIVVCSPSAARSHWVAQEIRAFRRLRTPANIIAVIAEGTPPSCFPESLIHPEDGVAAHSATPLEPLAADLQGGRSNRRMALYKLAAAMLQVDLDTLVRRQAQRRTRVLTGVACSALFGMVLMGWLTYTAMHERRAADLARVAADGARQVAESRRQTSEGLIEFMLSDLKQRLEPVGRLDVLDSVGDKVLEYYREQDIASLDASTQGRRARALQMLGEIQYQKGDTAATIDLMSQAAASTNELLEAEPDNPQRIFEHSQSLYWVGVVAMERGEHTTASGALSGYLALAQQLTRLEPHNTQWRLEVFYAHQVLGALSMEALDWSNAIQSFAQGLEVLTALRDSENSSEDYLNELASIHSWLRSAYLADKAYEKARQHAEFEVSTWEAVLNVDSRNYVALRQLLIAIRGQADLALVAGDTQAASASLQRAADLVDQLLQQEPDDTRNLEQGVAVNLERAELQQVLEDLLTAAEFTQLCLDGAHDLVQRDASNMWWQFGLMLSCQLQAVRQTAVRDGQAPALAMLQPVYDRVKSQYDSGYVERHSTLLWGETNLLYGDLEHQLDRSEEAVAFWRMSRDTLDGDPQNLSGKQLQALIQALTRLGDINRASELTAYLRSRGYRYPGFPP